MLNKILISIGNVQVYCCVQVGNQLRQDEDPTGEEDKRGKGQEQGVG